MKRLAVLLGLVVVMLSLLGGSSAAARPLAGDIDRSFADRGTFALAGNRGYVAGIAVQPDKKLVIAGGDWPTLQTGELSVVRLTPKGALDPTFGSGGVVKTQFTFWASANAVALQPDGKILVAGVSGTSAGQSDTTVFTLVRYRSDGALDAAFGQDGIVTTNIRPQSPPLDCWGSAATSLLVRPGGKILVGGGFAHDDCVDSGIGSFALVRYKSDGSLDSSFGNKGVVLTTRTGGDSIIRIAAEPDGKILAFGRALGYPDVDEIALARYHPDGALDTTFGDKGMRTTSREHRYVPFDAVQQKGGRTLVVGATLDKTQHERILLARFLRNGQSDRSFGRGGFLTLDRIESGGFGVVKQPHRMVMVAGDIWVGGRHPHSNLALVRLRFNGSLDPSFGKHGIRVIQRYGVFDRIASQADGRVLVGGEGKGAMTVLRFHGGHNCAVPRVTGKTAMSARRVIRQTYCRLGKIARRFSHRIGSGRVISQRPTAGEVLPAAAKVNLVVSKGKRR